MITGLQRVLAEPSFLIIRLELRDQRPKVFVINHPQEKRHTICVLVFSCISCQLGDTPGRGLGTAHRL